MREYILYLSFWVWTTSFSMVFIGVWIDIQVCDWIPLVPLSVFMPILDSFHYYSSVVDFEVRDAFRNSLIMQYCFGYPGVLVFPYKVEYCSFKFCEEFNGYCIDSVECF